MENNAIDIITRTKIVPVIKIDRAETALPLLKAIKDGGIGVAEITYRTAAAKEAIELSLAAFPDMLIGAGSVINLNQAKEAVGLGAGFIVSPGFSEEVAEFCVSNKVPYFGGCVTPTEIMKSLEYGLDIVKFFPAEAFGGLSAIKALSAPFSAVRFMPTGGISVKNIREYLSFPKVIACGGSWMVKDEYIVKGEFDKITELCREAVSEVNR